MEPLDIVRRHKNIKSALIVTLVILIILSTVSISAIFGENGLIKKAQEAKDHQSNAITMEEGEMDKLAEEYANVMASEGNRGGAVTPPTISPTTSYVGYYANSDDDLEPEGVIYADQAIGGSGQWYNSDGTYTIPKISSGLKSYYISQTGYSGPFGTKDVLTVVKESGVEDRFYVMALTDIDSSRHEWNTSGSMSVITQTGFGTGKTNTAAVMSQYKGDMWGLIEKQVAEGWFVPSKEEWSAFGGEIEIDAANYSSFKLQDWYWSSSQRDTANYAWLAHYGSICYMEYGHVGRPDFPGYVRLSTTF